MTDGVWAVSMASPAALVIALGGVQVAVLDPGTVPVLLTAAIVIVNTVLPALHAQVLCPPVFLVWGNYLVARTCGMGTTGGTPRHHWDYDTPLDVGLRGGTTTRD